MMDLSIVIPAYNEEARLERTVQRVAGFFRTRPEKWELIVVDDGSTDRTEEVLQSLQDRFEEVQGVSFGVNRGKGGAVKEGVLRASGKWILVTDADLAAPMEEYVRLAGPLREGWQVAIGSRGVRDAACQVKQSPVRYFGGRVFNFVIRSLVLGDFYDTQCGFKMFERQAGRDIFSRLVLEGFSFDIEALYLAKKRGYKIKEVPINWYAQSGSKIRLVQDAFIMIGDALRIKKIHG